MKQNKQKQARTYQLDFLKHGLSVGAVRVLSIMTVVVVAIIMYGYSIPRSYNLQPGSLATDEIVLTRAVINSTKTKEKAEYAASQVADVYHRSEVIAENSRNNVTELLAKITEVRQTIETKLLQDRDKQFLTKAELDENWVIPIEDFNVGVETLKNILPTDLASLYTQEQLELFISMRPSTYTMVSNHLTRLTDYMVSEELSSTNLPDLIAKQIKTLNDTNNYYHDEYELIGQVLSASISPNMVYDEEATTLSRNEAFKVASAQPVMIEKGTRVVSRGDKITQEQYQILLDADLLSSGKLDWQILLGVILTVLLLFGFANIYLQKHDKKSWQKSAKHQASIWLTIMLPFLIAGYASDFSPLASPVYFATIIFTAFYGMQVALVLSTALTLLVFPMTYMNFHFLFCAMFGILISSMVTDGFTRRDKYAFVILATSIAPAFASLAMDLILKTATVQTLNNMIVLAGVGALSAVAAIGMMPLYEIFLDAVSPLRLLELSNPNHPLMKRMLLEAPGTSQHCNMVAILAEVGAEVTGANPLLARVGALYHDLGKLENPNYFTENQNNENLHDYLTPEESREIIFSHVINGVKIAKEYRFPEAVIDFIREHHGDTVLIYFYDKACKLAEAQGLPLPDPKEYTYPGHSPRSKETGIVMLADSVEAAMKSTGYRDLVKAEALMRSIVKTKNEQNQLVNTGLSYQDVELMIQAFLQVYEGQFHERIKYPDANTIPKKQMPLVND